ncbi:hypothetical protein AB0M43_38365 [Longispora sp. NPDC051575]|uniref:hypothetical protein n=1 Tax=Longispora sp. NPDC051575 TaxID=3154943 RepID=UPI00341EA2A9
MTWKNVEELAGRVDWPATGAVVALVLLAVLVLLRITRRKSDAATVEAKHTTPWVDRAMVMLIGGVVTGTLAQAMWGFFEHKLGISDPWLLWPLFAVLEASLLYCVRSARRMLRWTLDHDPANASAGPAGKVLVFLISFMAVVAASDAHNGGAVMFRLGMPVLALMLLLLEMWEERFRARTLAGLAGPSGLKRFLPEWLLVALGRSELEVSGLALVRYTRRVARICRRLDYLTSRATGKDKLGRFTGWIIRGRSWRLRGKLERLMYRAPEGVTLAAVRRINAGLATMEKFGGQVDTEVQNIERAMADAAASHAEGPRATAGEPLARPDGSVVQDGPLPVAHPGHADGPVAQPDGPAVSVAVPVTRSKQHPAPGEPLPASQWPAPVGPRATPDGPLAQPVARVAQADGPVARPAEQAPVPAVRLEWRPSTQQPVDVPADTAPLLNGPDADGGVLPVSPELGPIGYVGTALDRGHRPAGVNGTHAPQQGGGQVAVLDTPASHGPGHAVSQPAGHASQTDGPRATAGEPVAHPDGPAGHGGPQRVAREPFPVAHPSHDGGPRATTDGPLAHGAPGPVAREPRPMAQLGQPASHASQTDGPRATADGSGEPLPEVLVERAGEARARIRKLSTGEDAAAESATAYSRIGTGDVREVVWLDGLYPNTALDDVDLEEFARVIYRASTSPDFERRLSDRALAELCGQSRRWAANRISEVTAADVEQQPGCGDCASEAKIPQQGGGQPA